MGWIEKIWERDGDKYNQNISYETFKELIKVSSLKISNKNKLSINWCTVYLQSLICTLVLLNKCE